MHILLIMIIINHKIPPPLIYYSGLYRMEQNTLKHCHRFFHHRNVPLQNFPPRFRSKNPLQYSTLWPQFMTPIHRIHSAFLIPRIFLQLRERSFDFYGGGGGWLEDFLKKKSRTELCRKKYLGQGKFHCTYCIIYK